MSEVPWAMKHPKLNWKGYRISQLSRMIVEADDDAKAKRYARTLRKTAEEAIEMAMTIRKASADA